VVALLYWTIRRSPGRWWLASWIASIPLLVFAILLAPVVVDPLFNKFEPLKNAELREKILALASRAGIERSRVYQVDASQRTKGVNAYVTGLGGSARIVLWDTTLEKLNDREILAVMAHEMGHYVEKHVLIGTLLSILGTLFLLLAVDRGARLVLARHGEAWGVRGIDDLASLPLLMLLVSLLNFFGAPVTNAVSRVMESRADTFSLRQTNDGRAAASSFVKLSELNLSNPDPPKFIEFWIFSHPTLRERIDKALAWPGGRQE
jgi:Zn-dependent protease with chaperone function